MSTTAEQLAQHQIAQQARRIKQLESVMTPAELARRKFQAAQDDAFRRGVLEEVIESDRTGRRVTRFIGHPELCWSPFKFPSRVVTRMGKC